MSDILRKMERMLAGPTTANTEDILSHTVYKIRDLHERKLYNFAQGMRSCVTQKKVYLLSAENLLSRISDRCFMSSATQGFFFFKNQNGFAEFECGKTTEISFFAEKTEDIMQELLDFLDVEEVDSYVNWVYNKHGEHVSVPVMANNPPLDSFYPFIDGTLEEYYDRFMNSDQAILVLIGPPGTGKSSFIKGLMQRTRKSAVVTYDKDLLTSDSVFAEFIYGNSTFFVLEDADNLLLPRKDGNDLMTKFLNVGEGLVKVPGKKLIFTTNLPNVSDIDPALVRPGRCFDVLQFRALTAQEGDEVRSDLKLPLTGEAGTLTEICNGYKAKEVRRFGFV